ncbi:fibroblast growth factor-binding protein 2-like [Amphiprion ocellaris]|uniref:Fibroblast growth factor binding protein 2b n=1 Tax=Amphiprion ocellaris TaxID=80972 RepID=A0A3Q1BF80_AMPOC|nr:fibroblast growth factor-binding protein 2-like [Amphiprion ocellaris]
MSLLYTDISPHPSPSVTPTPNAAMRAKMRLLLLVFAAAVCVSYAQTSNNSNDNRQQQQPQQQQQQQRSIWDEAIKFTTKTKDSCTMVVSGAGDYTRLRVSCKGQTPGRSYYCDFQGKPNLCRAYNLNPRHYFTQMMWDLRKLSHACQGPRIYRPQMCKKYPDEAQMTFLASWPKTTTPKPSKPVQEPRRPAVPAQTKPATTPKPVKPQSQPIKPQPGKGTQTKKTTLKPGKTTTRPTEQPGSKASRMASEYCWKSFHGICTYFISWFQN